MRLSAYQISQSFWLCVLAVFLSTLIVRSRGMSVEDSKKYYEILNAKGPKQPKHASAKEVARQSRNDVIKKLWISDRGDRLISQISSKTSDLIFILEKKSTQVVETLHDVKAESQQQLFYVLPDGRQVERNSQGLWHLKDKEDKAPLIISALPEESKPMQKLRYFEAKQANYNYSTDIFLAKDVKMWNYCTDGHHFVQNLEGLKPIGQGSAETVTLKFVKDRYQFNADRLKLKIFSQENAQ